MNLEKEIIQILDRHFMSISNHKIQIVTKDFLAMLREKGKRFWAVKDKNGKIAIREGVFRYPEIICSKQNAHRNREVFKGEEIVPVIIIEDGGEE